MGLQAFWYIAQWAFVVAGAHLFNVLLMEDDWWKAPAEAQKRAQERRKNKQKGEPITMLDNLYYTLDMSWWVPILIYGLAQFAAVTSVILFVSVDGIGNDLYWGAKPGALLSYVLLQAFLLVRWVPWFYRKCQSRCTEQYLFMLGCFVCACLLTVWFLLNDILAGILLVPLDIVLFVVFLFVFLAEYRCENVDRPQLKLNCQLQVINPDGSTERLL